MFAPVSFALTLSLRWNICKSKMRIHVSFKLFKLMQVCTSDQSGLCILPHKSQGLPLRIKHSQYYRNSYGYQSVIQANMLPRATVSQGLCISERSVLECAVRRGSNKTTNMIREPLRIYVSFFFLACISSVVFGCCGPLTWIWKRFSMSFTKVLNLFLQVIVLWF